MILFNLHNDQNHGGSDCADIFLHQLKQKEIEKM